VLNSIPRLSLHNIFNVNKKNCVENHRLLAKTYTSPSPPEYSITNTWKGGILTCLHPDHPVPAMGGA